GSGGVARRIGKNAIENNLNIALDIIVFLIEQRGIQPQWHPDDFTVVLYTQLEVADGLLIEGSGGELINAADGEAARAVASAVGEIDHGVVVEGIVQRQGIGGLLPAFTAVNHAIFQGDLWIPGEVELAAGVGNGLL